MVRFVFCSDTHIGAMPLGYSQQPGYPEKLPEIVAAMDAWITAQGDIDFVIHGGDLINRASADLVAAARDMFRLSVPVYLCLGNHDMMGPNALDLWLTAAPDLLHDGAADSRIVDQDAVIHIMPTHWDATPYFWDEGDDPRFGPDQLTWLRAGLDRYPDRPHVLVTHSQVLGLPVDQTGFDEPLRPATESFAASIEALAAEHPQLRCVLSGHTHLNMHIHQRGIHYVTASALPESPFEFKVIGANEGRLTMSTVSLSEDVGFAPRYDFHKTFVQGREKDRHFVDPLDAAEDHADPA